ncbi:helix-turn-helix transcriptional regulator [Nocardioides marmoribigeumensis]|uniref:ArsR family transcriptional regulator n=1 Tax=Nocardioides marmoribigeumensis TaxID=433649 RepID=A0ABU2BUG7_9ACTN|nr:helix-turn-helix domain-containing protein [Nocardioides marmoribigeumensis]MDR7361916.1 putative ArsR family transcriptional regulator [Nocardioides marmoribigeumensis]
MGDAEQWESVGVLAEPARRRLYEYVAGQPEPVTREQAADALAVPAHSVKFHLDKLAAAGLLEVDYRRVSGRTGPGAGRPAKLYRRSDREVALSVPPRRYDLVGEVLAEAVDRSVRGGVAIDDAVLEVARDIGRELGTAADESAETAALHRTGTVLADHGYEPREDDGELCLTNCPFDRLAADHTELVCGINLALVDGVLDGLSADTLQARLAPQPGLCCVRVGSAG